MNDEPVVLCDIDARGVATVTINRPRVNNAYNGEIVDALLDGAVALGANSDVRLIVIRGNGRHFQAGADLKWLKAVSSLSVEENIEVSRHTTNAIRYLDNCPKPTLALVHGACVGGGTGIAAACDIVIASEDATFAIAEARWGVMAGPIFPQLNAAMGSHNVRRYAQTSERFTAAEAREMGFVHEVCPVGGLDDAAAPVIEAILSNGPNAVTATKALIRDMAGLEIDDEAGEALARGHAMKRMSAEADEGLTSFAEKREAAWYPGAKS